LPAPSATELPGYPISKYMRRFLDLGQPIHFVHYRKRDDLPAGSIVKPTLEPGFRTAQKLSGHD